MAACDLQFWLKQTVPSMAWCHERHRVTMTWACVSALARWRDPFWLKQGVILDMVHRRKVVTTEASNKGCEVKPTFGLWSEEESGLHINCLEMLAGCQACQFFPLDIRGHHVLVRSDSRSMVSYISNVSKQLCMLANDLFVWAQNNLLSLKATHVPGKINQEADMLSRNNVSSEEKDAPPAHGSENLWSLWQSSNRPLRLRRQLSLPKLFYKELGYPGPRKAQPSALCFPPSRSAAAGTQSTQGTTAQAYSNSPPLEEPTVGVGVIPAAEISPVADPLETWPPFSSERHAMASTARVMGSACVAARREPLGLSERVLNTMAEARGPLY